MGLGVVVDYDINSYFYLTSRCEGKTGPKAGDFLLYLVAGIILSSICTRAYLRHWR
ncbi:hypothetical protein M433DRAFT_445675 [Acidomyces richmondensis BFW]|nr:MAG: hypothetical protein FE78DRAFT_233290 [Acidomyces sp. 'richmondensis']KYG41928.1 hypothetical protein M433DRAFT_445675 [Acidomyces richmondensis BFW]